MPHPPIVPSVIEPGRAPRLAPMARLGPGATLGRRQFAGLMALALLGAGCSAPAQATPSASFPAFVSASSASLEAYQVALRHADLLAVIPCYCGCTGAHHRNLKDCFIKPDSSFDSHASACAICIQEAMLAARLRQEGQEVKAIRAAIDTRFASYGPPTDTPLP